MLLAFGVPYAALWAHMPWLADTFAFAALCVWGWRVGGSVFGAFFLFTAFPHVTLEASLASLTHLGALMGGALFVFSFGKRAQSSLFERIVFFGLGSFISAFLLSINASLEEISLTWTGTLSLPLFLPHLAQFLLSFFVVLLLQRGFVSSTRHFEPNLSFEHLFQNLPIPVAYKDTKGVYQGCNRAFTVLIGSAKTEVIKHLQSLPPKHTQHTHLPYDNNVLKEVHLTCEKVTNDTGVLLGSVCLLVDITEFETLKKRLQYWKERYELALDGANDGLWDWDVVNDTVFFSRRWKEIMGYKPHENPNHVDHWLGLIGDADSKHVTSELRAHLKGSSPVFEVEHQCVHLDNAVRWVKVQGKALFDSTHKPVRMVGYVSDITQTKKAQHALKESQELFLRFMNALPALAFIRNTEGAFTYMNASYEKFIGGKEWREKKADAIFPQSVATLLQNQDRLTLYEGIGQHEQRFPDVLGKEHIFQSFNFPFQDAKGARMLGGIALDITKERLLEERTKLFANIFETTSEGIMVTDSAGKIVTINHAFTLLTGFTAADVLGKNPRIRKSGHHDKAFYEALWKTLLETGAWKGELYNLHNDGEVVPERLSISTIKNERGEVAYFVGIFTNISEQKAQEKRLEALAHYDTLTGIPSRFLFLDRLDQCIANTLRTQKKAALLFIDLDDFKPINDTYGHEAGDEVLKTIATRLSAQIRRSDTVARLAGDEFVVLLTNLTSGADLRMLCSKILATIQEPILFKTETLRVGASIGICVCPDHGDTVEALLRHADEAMYQVKKQGKRAMGIYKPSTKTH